MLRWLSNTHDPKDPNAKEYVATFIGQSREQAWEMHQRWLAGKLIGKPQATAFYSVEELEEMGIVGVYVYD